MPECWLVTFPELVAYAEGLRLQYATMRGVQSGQIPETLIFLEHSPVITIGRRGRADSDLLSSPAQLRTIDIDVVETDRGGQITYHCPGQLVGYPILNLEQALVPRDLHWYLRALEQMIIEALSELGLSSDRKAGLTGVWVGESKIAAIGIRVSRWITMHGFAINNTCDLAPFRRDIVACGIRDKDVTSLMECGIRVDRSSLELEVHRKFARCFNKSLTVVTPGQFIPRLEALT